MCLSQLDLSIPCTQYGNLHEVIGYQYPTGVVDTPPCIDIEGTLKYWQIDCDSAIRTVGQKANRGKIVECQMSPFGY